MTRQIPTPGFKVVKDKKGRDRLVFDHKKAEAKLSVSTRLKRRNSKEVRVGKKLEG